MVKGIVSEAEERVEEGSHAKCGADFRDFELFGRCGGGGNAACSDQQQRRKGRVGFFSTTYLEHIHLSDIKQLAAKMTSSWIL